MKNIFIVYGHYNQNSFNAAIKNTFTQAAQKKGHTVDCVDLYKEKFNPVYAGEKPDEVVLDHQKRIDCLLYTSPSPRDAQLSRMPSSA